MTSRCLFPSSGPPLAKHGPLKASTCKKNIHHDELSSRMKNLWQQFASPVPPTARMSARGSPLRGAPAAVSASRGPGEIEKVDKAPTFAAAWCTLSLAQDQIRLLTLSLLRSLVWRLGCGCCINRRADVSSPSSSGKWSGTDCGSLAPTHAVYCRCWHVDRWAARCPCGGPLVAGVDGRAADLCFLLFPNIQLVTSQPDARSLGATHNARLSKVSLALRFPSLFLAFPKARPLPCLPPPDTAVHSWSPLEVAESRSKQLSRNAALHFWALVWGGWPCVSGQRTR